jgi:hypothetical protein
MPKKDNPANPPLVKGGEGGFDYQVDNLKNDVGINPCQNIVQHNPISASCFFRVANGRRFDDVEESKKKKPKGDEERRLWNPEHGHEESEDFINDNPRMVFPAPIILSSI